MDALKHIGRGAAILLAALLASGGAAAYAQEQPVALGATTDQAYRAGWTFTPSFGVSETYDDNISLFGEGTAVGENVDTIGTYAPEADLHYSGKHTRFGASYAGSFLQYRTFTALNRWDQRGRLELRHTASARLHWFARGNLAKMPSTDLIDLGGIPFRHTGAQTADGRAGFEYRIDARNAVATSAGFQSIDFERPQELRAYLRGGHVFDSLTSWRHRMDSRLALGGDYTFRRASVVDDPELFNLHTMEAAIDYALSSEWALSAGAGIVTMQSTPTIAGRTGPAYRISVDQLHNARTFHVGYVRSYIPSFGFGGTVENQEIAVGLRAPLFHSRHLYTSQSATFRDDEPLTDHVLQLPLRSLRTYSVFGWEMQRWARLEIFYARVDQSSLRAGGRLSRNRLGFQIVTSKPVRMQ